MTYTRIEPNQTGSVLEVFPRPRPRRLPHWAGLLADDPDFSREQRLLPRPLRWALNLLFLVWLRAQTNGGAIATTQRLRRLRPALLCVAELAGVAALLLAPVPAPWSVFGPVVLTFMAGSDAVMFVETLRWPRGAIFLANFKRDPATPEGEGAVLLAALCERADEQDAWLGLHTKEEWRIRYFERFGFVEVRRAKTRVTMRRPPQRTSVAETSRTRFSA